MNESNPEKTIKKESEETGRLDRIYFDEKGGLKIAAVKNKFREHNAKLIQTKAGDLIFAALLNDPRERDEYLKNFVNYKKYGNVSGDENPFYDCYAGFVKYFRKKPRFGGMRFLKSEFQEGIANLSKCFDLDGRELESFFRVDSYDEFALIDREVKPAQVAVILMHEINHLGEDHKRTNLFELAKKVGDISGEEYSKDFLRIYEILTDIRALSLVPEETLNLAKFGYLNNLYKKDLLYLRELVYGSGAKNTKEVLEFLRDEIVENSRLENILRKEFPNKKDDVWEGIKKNFQLIIDEILNFDKYKSGGERTKG